MTFDDFKKKFEIYSKIDTTEKLGICESQYEKYLLEIEDEKYFEPTKNDLSDNIISQYEKNLNQILCFDDITENQVCFLVKPSFEPEYLLVLEKMPDKFVLTLTTLTKNYWAVFYANNKIMDIEKKVITSELNTAIGNKIFKLLGNTIIEARQPKAGRYVLDGVVYILSKLSNGEQKIVSKNSPSETSKSGQIIEIMQQLINNIANLDDAVLLNIETKITAVQA